MTEYPHRHPSAAAWPPKGNGHMGNALRRGNPYGEAVAFAPISRERWTQTWGDYERLVTG